VPIGSVLVSSVQQMETDFFVLNILRI